MYCSPKNTHVKVTNHRHLKHYCHHDDETHRHRQFQSLHRCRYEQHHQQHHHFHNYYLPPASRYKPHIILSSIDDGLPLLSSAPHPDNCVPPPTTPPPPPPPKPPPPLPLATRAKTSTAERTMVVSEITTKTTATTSRIYRRTSKSAVNLQQKK
uniref:Uncharacterized protein n=1 Tax=Octopus bimaculoides TaxID=37653 RepID=A0A0L8HR53_OCTBM